MNTSFELHLDSRLSALQILKKAQVEEIDRAVQEIVHTFTNGGKLFICGNGGSAADAQHVAAEFVNGMSHPNNLHLPAIALTTDTSVMTAHANDYNFGGVFEVQLQALARPGDCVLLLSTSGKSQNILQAHRYCQDFKLSTILITGSTSFTNHESTIVLEVPSANTQVIQEVTLIIEHYLCEKVIENMKRAGSPLF